MVLSCVAAAQSSYFIVRKIQEILKTIVQKEFFSFFLKGQIIHLKTFFFLLTSHFTICCCRFFLVLGGSNQIRLPTITDSPDPGYLRDD